MKINTEERLVLFIKKLEAEEIEDESSFFDWYAAKKGLDILNKSLEIIWANEI